MLALVFRHYYSRAARVRSLPFHFLLAFKIPTGNKQYGIANQLERAISEGLDNAV
jgi:hypothetical protein